MENVHYHGTPIWGNKGEVLKVAIKGAGAFVSYWRQTTKGLYDHYLK